MRDKDEGNLENHKMRNRKGLFLVGCLIFSCLALVYYLHVIGGINSGTGNNLGFFTKRARYQYKPEYSELNGPDVRYNDPRVLQKLKVHHLHRWWTNNYNLTNTTADYDPSMGQGQIVIELYKNDKKNNQRFFVECGALDGELRSNTLYLERVLGWQGLLIEADPDNFKELKWKRRKSWASNSCLSTKPYPTMVSFEQKVNQGRISSFTAGYLESGFVDVQCYPFSTYMTLLNRTSVDYFSLDVEGLELEILKTIDFDKYDVKVLSVEFIHDKEGKEAIREFMERKGYYVKALVTHPNWLANDFIFVKEDFKI